jgi:hypothetical protein
LNHGDVNPGTVEYSPLGLKSFCMSMTSTAVRAVSI